MNDKKPDLYTIERASIEGYPSESVDKFVSDIESGISPSRALLRFIESNSCNELDSSVILDLLRRAYKGIDIGEISGIIHDSGYPFGSSDDMSDVEFDKIVIKAYENTSEW